MHVALREVTWLYGVYRTCAKMAAVSCGTCHASALSIPLRWIFKKQNKKRYKKLVTRVEPHASADSLLKRAENRVYKRSSSKIFYNSSIPITHSLSLARLCLPLALSIALSAWRRRRGKKIDLKEKSQGNCTQNDWVAIRPPGSLPCWTHLLR